jgi:hypothetical protein
MAEDDDPILSCVQLTRREAITAAQVGRGRDEGVLMWKNRVDSLAGE